MKTPLHPPNFVKCLGSITGHVNKTWKINVFIQVSFDDLQYITDIYFPLTAAKVQPSTLHYSIS